MPDEVVVDVVVPPAAVVVPAVVTPPAPAVVAPVVPTEEEQQKWLKPRLEQAKRSAETALLATLGVKDAAEANALLEKARAAEEAQKSELQRKDERIKALETTAAKVTEYEQTIKGRAEFELSQLTDAQRASVTTLAGADMAKTLTTIDALKPTWVVPPAPVVATPPPAVVTPPVTSAPPPNAPGGVNVSPPDHRARYKEIKASGNAVAASQYLKAYEHFIYPRS